MVVIRYLSNIIVSSLLISSGCFALPATRAYLNVPELEQLARSYWGAQMQKYKPILDQVIEKEDEFEYTHQVFYHAQDASLRVYQDFLGLWYNFLHSEEKIKDFYFLRSWHDFPPSIDANMFIEEQEQGTPKDWNDNKSSLVKKMLSVNFSLFGNTRNYGNFGECTFKYFFMNRSIKLPLLTNLIEEFFAYYGINKKYISQLIELNKKIATSEGSLYQIFVPNHLVDVIGFAAQRLGTPYRTQIIPEDFNYTKMRHMHLTPLLSAYRNDTQTLVHILDRFQGRLLFSQDILLNPFSDVKIFRYTTIDRSVFKKYKKELKELVRHIFKKWNK